MRKVLLILSLLSFISAQCQLLKPIQLNQKHSGSIEIGPFEKQYLEGFRSGESKIEDFFNLKLAHQDIPLSGEYSFQDKFILFTPTFPFESQLEYRITYFNQDTILTYDAKEKIQSVVTAIYPQIDEIPENLLRFYIKFSSPMREGNFLDHIKLFDEEGNNISGVFFDNQYELWNEDFTQITILVDPGRVKTGLNANREMGRAFKVGKKYKLVIESTWPSLDGMPLKNDFTKEFIGVKQDVESPSVEKWTYNKPKIKSKEPLVINFNEALDHICVMQYVRFTDGGGKKLEGNYILKENHTTLEFYPNNLWRNDKMILKVNSRLEDVVGNNLNGLFDHKLGELKSEVEGETLNFKLNIW